MDGWFKINVSALGIKSLSSLMGRTYMYVAMRSWSQVVTRAGLEFGGSEDLVRISLYGSEHCQSARVTPCGSGYQIIVLEQGTIIESESHLFIGT